MVKPFRTLTCINSSYIFISKTRGIYNILSERVFLGFDDVLGTDGRA